MAKARKGPTRARSSSPVLSPEEALVEVANLVRMTDLQRRRLDLDLAIAVEVARVDGLSWQDIGTVLGVTRQAAFQRFGRRGEA
jgi:hypothetical protein